MLVALLPLIRVICLRVRLLGTNAAFEFAVSGLVPSFSEYISLILEKS